MKELILRNLNQIRRRSILLWKGLPETYYSWKPDDTAMTAIKMVRHVLQADYGWNIIINQGDMSNYHTPSEGKPIVSVQDELKFAEPYRLELLKSIEHFSEDELSHVNISHPGINEKKNLGDYLLRIGYHESVHAGQFLSYLRAMKIERPFIWD